MVFWMVFNDAYYCVYKYERLIQDQYAVGTNTCWDQIEVIWLIHIIFSILSFHNFDQYYRMYIT